MNDLKNCNYFKLEILFYDFNRSAHIYEKRSMQNLTIKLSETRRTIAIIDAEMRERGFIIA
jgi:hypothetical protein